MYFLSSILNSFIYDYALRCRLGGLHLSYFIIEETPLIPPARILPTICAQLAARLNLIMPSFAPQWLEMRAAYPYLGQQHWRKLWAITGHERLRLRCILDAIVAESMGWMMRILRGSCAMIRAIRRVSGASIKRTAGVAPYDLALEAFKRLKEVGLEDIPAGGLAVPRGDCGAARSASTPWQEELRLRRVGQSARGMRGV